MQVSTQLNKIARDNNMISIFEFNKMTNEIMTIGI